jgi:hypothetical protein
VVVLLGVELLCPQPHEKAQAVANSVAGRLDARLNFIAKSYRKDI